VGAQARPILAIGLISDIHLHMTLADLPQVQALPAQEKLQLLDELWLDIAHSVDSLEVTAEEKTLLDDRWNRFVSNPSSALSLEEFQDRLRALRA
jgi:putative addiction module component (TIGR02574 family)